MTELLAGIDLASPIRSASVSVGPASTAAQRQAMQTAKDFESLLVHELLKEMKETIPSESDDAGGEQIQGMFWSFLSQEISNKGGLGLWKNLYQQMQAHTAAPAAAQVEQNL